MRALVFGDVGGHYTPFVNALRAEGIDVDNFVIPEDTIIVQIGDLVHRGPDSDKVVALADSMMLTNYNRWYQLFGNHEAMHLDDTMDFYKCNCSQSTANTIRRWWEEHQAHVAISMQHAPTKRLISPLSLLTHAGVMYSWWRRASKEDAQWTAEYLNGFQPMEATALDQPGEMMGIGPRNNAGPWWAQCTHELYPSWEQRDAHMPFNQIHGHSTPWMWDRNAWSGGTPLRYRKQMKLSLEERVCWLPSEDGQATFAAIDPGYGKQQTQEIMSHLVIQDVHDVLTSVVY